MPVCPKCGDAHLTQKVDKGVMQCGAGHRFKLVELRHCLNCGEYKTDLLPNSICKSCITSVVVEDIVRTYLGDIGAGFPTLRR